MLDAEALLDLDFGSKGTNTFRHCNTGTTSINRLPARHENDCGEYNAMNKTLSLSNQIGGAMTVADWTENFKTAEIRAAATDHRH